MTGLWVGIVDGQFRVMHQRRVDQVGEVAAEAVELPDDEHVALP